MQAAKLPAISGWYWTREGWSLFRQHPLILFTWSLVLSLMVLFALNVPMLGPLLNIVLMPALMLISFSLGKKISERQALAPSVWLELLQRPSGVFKNMLLLGLIYSVVCTLAGFLAFMPFMDELISAAEQFPADAPDLSPLLLAALYKPLTILTVLFIIIGAFFWYAPVLLAWHQVRVFQALFFSIVVCWRNKWTFLVYGLSWVLIFLAIDLCAEALIATGLSVSLVSTLKIPFSLAANGVLCGSFYPSYLTVFGSDRSGSQLDDSNGSQA